MPPAIHREEFLWRNGRLVSETVQRPTLRSRWPYGIRRNLVVAIEDTGGHRKITHGPQANPLRIAQAYIRYRNLHCNPRTPDIGSAVPDSLLKQVSQACEAAVQKLVRQYEAVAIEEGATGLFSGEMNGIVFSQGEWQATIFVQSFSPETKEPLVGADFGAVIDLRRGNKRVVKGFIAQAKRVNGIPNDPQRLPDLSDQIPLMQAQTDESYVLLYGHNQVEFRHSQHLLTSISVPSVIGDAIRCNRGDRRPVIVAQALDRDLVLEVAIAGPGAEWPFSAGHQS
jgi:hypothetical protein